MNFSIKSNFQKNIEVFKKSSCYERANFTASNQQEQQTKAVEISR